MTISVDLKITNKLGLHARASALLVSCASHYKCEITLTKQNDTVNAKSILGVMALGAGYGSELSLTANGIDEEEALTTLRELFENKFDEGE